MSNRRVFAMILAAGQSRRMGRPKLTLRYRDGTILESVIQAVLESPIDGLAVVSTPQVGQFLGDSLPERCTVVINGDPQSEMFESVKLGLANLKAEYSATGDDGIMVLLGDQPQVTGGTITTCAEAYRLPRTAPGVLITTYGGRRGHPTVFSFGLLCEISGWSADRKLNELARLYPQAVRELPITTGPMPIDVNSPEDYDRLREQR